MAKEDSKDPNEVNVLGATDPNGKRVIVYGAGDPALIQKDGKTYVGIVDSVDKGEVTLSVKNINDVKEVKGTTNDFEPLFFENEDGKKVWTKFSYGEITRAQRNTENFKVEISPKQIVSLMLGNRSGLISFNKLIEDKMVTVEGKIELRRTADGAPVISHLVKNKELNLDRPIYGFKLDEAQKQKISTTDELGLISGFKAGDREFSLWISLDRELNAVVTRREKDVNIDRIYGVSLSDQQKETLKQGEGVLVELKNGEKIFAMASASTSKADGLKIYSEEKAKEFKLIKEEKKNDLGKSESKKAAGHKM